MKLEDVSARAINEMINWVQATGAGVAKYSGKAFDWASVQIPDVIRQFLMWRATEAMLYTLFGLVVITVPILATVWVYKKTRNWGEYSGSTELRVTSTICAIAGVVGGSIMVANNLLTLAQIWVAPKVFLIQELAKLVKAQ